MKAKCPTWLLPEDQWQMVMFFRSVLPLFVAVILGTSCESLTAPDTVNDLYWDVFDQRRNRYEIDEGDTVTIKLFDAEKEQLREQFLTILPDGRSDPFFMPNYRFSGKTIPEVEEDIVEFVKGVERNAEVSIVVLPGPQTVYVGGQVERPGSVVLTPDMTFDEALAVVGCSVTRSEELPTPARSVALEIPVAVTLSLADGRGRAPLDRRSATAPSSGK